MRFCKLWPSLGCVLLTVIYGRVTFMFPYRITRIISAANVQKIQFGGTYNPAQVSVFNTVGIRKVSASPFFTLLYRTVRFSTRCDILLGARPGF